MLCLYISSKSGEWDRDKEWKDQSEYMQDNSVKVKAQSSDWLYVNLLILMCVLFFFVIFNTRKIFMHMKNLRHKKYFPCAQQHSIFPSLKIKSIIIRKRRKKIKKFVIIALAELVIKKFFKYHLLPLKNSLFFFSLVK